MTTFLNGAELASYLEVDRSPAIDTIVDLTNSLVTEEWATVADPVPAWVRNIAWAVAIRAGANPKGLTSQTRAWDDITRTERWETGATTGVALTDDEKTRLNAVPTTTTPRSAARSIRLRITDWTSPRVGPWNY